MPDTPDTGYHNNEHLGPMIRRLRLGAGLSQDELARTAEEHAGRAGALDRGQISRWEREARLPGPYWIGPLADALGVPVGHLRQARGRSRSARGASAPAAPSVAAVLGELLPPGESLAPAVTTGGRRVGRREVDLMLRRVHSLRLADDVVAGGDLVRPLMRELAAARELYAHSAHSEQVGRGLLVGIAELAQLAGWVASDAGGAVDAAHLFRLGAAAAREAGDRPLLGHLLGSLAYFETNRGNVEVGFDLARALAAESGPDVPPRARSLIRDRTAWCAVRAGHTQTAMRAVGESAEALAEHEPGDDADRRWLYWVSDDERRIMEARVYTETHKPLRAVPLLRDVLATYPASHVRELALYESWLAVALLDANEPEAAAAAARRTLELSASVPSSRAGDRGGVVLKRLRAHVDVPEIAEVVAEWAA